jgi:2-iminobutanoate/2-iminopropanoate deaminase
MAHRCLLLALLVGAGCGPSEDRVRELIREEFAAATSRSYITSGQVVGPYSPAVRVGGFLFVSGQLGLDPATGTLSPDIESQTHQALKNLTSLLREAGLDSSHVIQCTVFLRDMKEFQRMNLIYGGFFDERGYPARTTVEVTGLPRDARVEIAAIAYQGPRL